MLDDLNFWQTTTSTGRIGITNLEQKRGQIEAIKQDALAQSITPTRRLVDIGRINFQSYNDIKAAFSKAYSITFSSLGVDSKTIEDLKRLISYRHQVVHVAPTYGFLNQLKVPPEERFFQNAKTLTLPSMSLLIL